MGQAPCDALEVEMALDRIEAQLKVELPAHMRAFARAHAEGRPPPPAPPAARAPATAELAHAACRHDFLRERGLALLRLTAPLVIEDDRTVTAVRAQPPSWDGLVALSAAREVVALARFRCTAIELAHRLHGIEGVKQQLGVPPEPGPAIDGWQARDFVLDQEAIVDVWQAIAARLGVAGQVRVDRAAPRVAVHPRAFVVEPQVEVIVVVPHEIATPAARFAVLHELGHAAAALAQPAGVPRVLDEAVASFVARFAEPPSWLPARWESSLAPAARRRRTAIALALDWIERALPVLRAPVGAAPAWGLWHDPGAQAAYVAAELIADRLQRDLGPRPPRGELSRLLEIERGRIDRRTNV